MCGFLLVFLFWWKGFGSVCGGFFEFFAWCVSLWVYCLVFLINS